MQELSTFTVHQYSMILLRIKVGEVAIMRAKKSWAESLGTRLIMWS